MYSFNEIFFKCKILWGACMVLFQGGHTSMNQQVLTFGNTIVPEMRRFFRGDAIALNSYLSRCIFYSGMGSNDYLNNYYMPNFYTTSSDFTTKAYAAALLQDYSRQLTVSSKFSEGQCYTYSKKPSCTLVQVLKITKYLNSMKFCVNYKSIFQNLSRSCIIVEI